MYEPSYSVLGGIDIVCMLKTFLPRISKILVEGWLQSTKFLRLVSLVFILRLFGDLVLVDALMFY